MGVGSRIAGGALKSARKAQKPALNGSATNQRHGAVTRPGAREGVVAMVWTYRGVVIFKNEAPGHRLKYSARTAAGMVAADTLAGIRQLIREAI